MSQKITEQEPAQQHVHAPLALVGLAALASIGLTYNAKTFSPEEARYLGACAVTQHQGSLTSVPYGSDQLFVRNLALQGITDSAYVHALARSVIQDASMEFVWELENRGQPRCN